MESAGSRLMYSLHRFPSRVGRLGKPLPDPFPTFGSNRVHFRRGATSMLAGQPGSFKSVLALNMLKVWAEESCGAIYFSADSDEPTVFKRFSGIVTGQDSFIIDRAMQNGHAIRYAEEIAPLVGKVKFEYSVIDIDAIASRMESYEHAFGAYPDVAFIDNLINYADNATDWGAMIDLLKELDSMAREFSCHICVLHHASEGFPRGLPLPSAAIQGKVTQIPRLVLTTAANETALMVTCVKNTNGMQYPQAHKWMNFLVQDSLRVTDLDYAEMMKAA